MVETLTEPFTPAAFRRAWADRSLTAEMVGARFGITKRQAHTRAQRLGLTPKPIGRRTDAKREAQMRAMWCAGVRSCEIADTLGGITPRAVQITARRLGWPARRKGPNRAAISITDYQQSLLATAMAEAARVEQAQLHLAEMVDRPKSGRRAA